jgi:hypothetical protein
MIDGSSTQTPWRRASWHACKLRIMAETIIPFNRNRLSRVSFSAGIVAAATLISTFIIAIILEGLDSIPMLYLALVFTLYFLYAFALLAPLIAITTGVISLRQIKKSGETGKGHAITGILLGIVGLLPMILIISSWW